MKTKTIVMLSVLLFGNAFAQTHGGYTTEGEANRARIEAAAQKHYDSQNRQMTVTSGYRTNSNAHKNGAIDISSRNESSDQRFLHAIGISKNLGKQGRVIVEEVHTAPVGPSGQCNTQFVNGNRARRDCGPVTATGSHIHVQP